MSNIPSISPSNVFPGAHNSHVHQSTGNVLDGPNASASTCISFTFYSPTGPCPFAPPPDSAIAAALNTLADAVMPDNNSVLSSPPPTVPNTPASSVISIESSIDYPTTIADSVYDNAPLAADPTAALQPATNLTAQPAIAQLAPGFTTQPAPVAQTPSIAQPIHAEPIATPSDGLTSGVTVQPTSIAQPTPKSRPVGLTHAATERWYCVTVGRQVGAMQGW
jgi:hypothetical protein